MKLIRAVFSLTILLSLISSCTLLKTGIEKRKYRPGFYLNSSSLNHTVEHRNIGLAHNASKFSTLKNIVTAEKKILDAPIVSLTKLVTSNLNRHTNALTSTKTFLPPKIFATEAITSTATPMEGSTNKHYLRQEILGLLLVIAIVTLFYLGVHLLFPSLSFIQALLIAFGIFFLLGYLKSLIFPSK